MIRSAQQENSIANVWRELFAKWPSGFKRKGVAIATFGEAVQFCDFVLNGDVVVLERPTPDTVGARRVVLPFALIEAVKYIEPLKTQQFLENGFVAGVSAPVAAAQTASGIS